MKLVTADQMNSMLIPLAVSIPYSLVKYSIMFGSNPILAILSNASFAVIINTNIIIKHINDCVNLYETIPTYDERQCLKATPGIWSSQECLSDHFLLIRRTSHLSFSSLQRLEFTKQETALNTGNFTPTKSEKLPDLTGGSYLLKDNCVII